MLCSFRAWVGDCSSDVYVNPRGQRQYNQSLPDPGLEDVELYSFGNTGGGWISLAPRILGHQNKNIKLISVLQLNIISRFFSMTSCVKKINELAVCTKIRIYNNESGL